jgi:hypothetical protein
MDLEEFEQKYSAIKNYMRARGAAEMYCRDKRNSKKELPKHIIDALDKYQLPIEYRYAANGVWIRGADSALSVLGYEMAIESEPGKYPPRYGNYHLRKKQEVS